jgi:hypothetical protein
MGADPFDWVAFAGDVTWQPGAESLANIAGVLREWRVVGQDPPILSSSSGTTVATWEPPTRDLDQDEWDEVFSELFGDDDVIGTAACWRITVILGPRVHVPAHWADVSTELLTPPPGGVRLDDSYAGCEYIYDVPGYDSVPVVKRAPGTGTLDSWQEFEEGWFRSHIQFAFLGIPAIGSAADELLGDLSEETGVEWYSGRFIDQ